MAKRKSRKKPKPKKKYTFPYECEFDCPVCNHIKTVYVELKKKIKMGLAECYLCEAYYYAALNNLSAPIDIYSEWIDTLDKEAEEKAKKKAKLG